MFKNATVIWRPLSLLLLASGIAHAQTTPPVTEKSGLPRFGLSVYTSVFDNYKSYSDDKTLDWKDANRQVQLRGGWRQYAKETQDPEPKPGPTTSGTIPTADRVVPKPKP